MTIMRSKNGVPQGKGKKSDRNKLPEAKAASKATATKPVTPPKPPAAPVIQPTRPAPVISSAKAPADGKPPTRKETPAPQKVTTLKPAKAEAIKTDLHAEPAKPVAKPLAIAAQPKPAPAPVAPPVPAAAPAAAPTSAPVKHVVLDAAVVAQAVLAQTAPALEAVARRIEARIDSVESAAKRAESKAQAVEQGLGRVETHVAQALEKSLSGLTERLEKVAKSVAQATQAAQAAKAAVTARAEETAPSSLDDELDQIGRTMKRAFVESFERSTDRVALPLVKVQRYIEEIARRAGAEAPALSEHLSICVGSLGAVLTDLAVEPFEPEADEEFDPIIHQAVSEAHRTDAPNGAVVKCVAPGYRNTRGHVLLPALVVVNRR